MAKLTDREFVERAVVAGHISEAQGEECLELVRRMQGSGAAVPVSQVLADKGYLTEANVRSVRYGGKVLTLACTTCGNECRVRGRRSSETRKCPKCGGRLAEEGDLDESPEDEPQPIEAGQAHPRAASPAPTEASGAAGEDDHREPTAPLAAATPDETGASPPDAEPGPAAPASTDEQAAPEPPASPTRLWDKCLEICTTRWVLTAALALVYALLLRGLFWLVGIR